MAVQFSEIQTDSGNAPAGTQSLEFTMSTLAVGQMMIVVVGSYRGQTSVDGWTPPAGWASLNTNDDGTDRAFEIFWKIAAAGDISSPTFSFSADFAGTPAVGVMAGFCMSLSSTSTFSGAGNITATSDEIAASATPSYTPGITPESADALYILGTWLQDSMATVSAYAIASNNPTWTERADVNFDGTNRNVTIAVATATATSASASGNYSLTLSGSATSVGFLLSVGQDPDVTVSVQPLSLSASIQAPAPAGATDVAPAVVTLTSSVNGPAVATAASKWSNADKSAPGAITNQDKS